MSKGELAGWPGPLTPLLRSAPLPSWERGKAKLRGQSSGSKVDRQIDPAHTSKCCRIAFGGSNTRPGSRVALPKHNLFQRQEADFRLPSEWNQGQFPAIQTDLPCQWRSA